MAFGLFFKVEFLYRQFRMAKEVVYILGLANPTHRGTDFLIWATIKEEESTAKNMTCHHTSF
jgi:hypothetical protein